MYIARLFPLLRGLPAPDTPLAHDAFDFALEVHSPALANHSVRTYLFARLTADQRGLRPDTDYDDEVLFLACVLHDVGLTEDLAEGTTAFRERREAAFKGR